MLKSTTIFKSSLSTLAMACAMAAFHVQPAAAQTATNLDCDGCVNGDHIADGTIRTKDLAPAVLFGRTVVVRSNAGSAAGNCDNLRNRVNNIDDASATEPVLVRLESGTYNCRSTPITMKRFVIIEGAGRNLSTITGNVADFDQGVINGAHNTALRHLTVENRANGSGTAIAIHTGGHRMSLTDVAIRVDSTTANNIYGILANGGALSLTNVSVQTSNPAGGGQGISADSGARLDMMNVWIRNFSGAGNPAALQLFDGSVTGFGVLFSSNIFGVLGFGNSVFELVDGTVIGSRGVGSGFTGSFTCVGIADGNLDVRADDCS